MAAEDQDKVVEGIERLQSTMGEFASELKRTNANVDILQQTLTRLCEDHYRRIGAIEARIGEAKKETREAVRQTSDADAKLESKQAGMLIAIEENKKATQQSLAVAVKALQAIQKVEQTTKTVATETTAQTPMIQAATDAAAAAKPKVAVTLAAIANLLIALLYAYMEFSKTHQVTVQSTPPPYVQPAPNAPRPTPFP